MENRKHNYSDIESPLSFMGDYRIEKILKDIRVQEENGALFHQLKKTNPKLYNHLFHMGKIRDKIGQAKLSNSLTQRNYFRGAAFMDRAIRISYQQRGLNVPRISPRVLETYFFDLMGGEDAHLEIEILKNKRFLPFTADKPFAPIELVDCLISERVDPEQQNALAVTLDNFISNSDQLAYDMTLKEQQLFKSIEKMRVLPGLRQRVGKTNLFETSSEFVLGAAEIYYPFEAQRQVDRLNEMWQR